MHSREEKSSNVFVDVPFSTWNKLISGSIGGTFLRWGLLPIEKAQLDASLPSSTKSNLQLLKENCSPKALRQLKGIFMQTCSLQTFAKSASNFGVYRYVDQDPRFSHYSAFSKGMIAAFTAASCETMLVSYHEILRVQRMSHMSNVSFKLTENIGTKELFFSMRATFIRAIWSGVVTFVPMMISQNKLTPCFVDHGMNYSEARALATFIPALSVQPLIVPFINFHTHMLSDPTIRFKTARHKFFQDKRPSDYMRGTLFRCLHRGLHYPLADMACHWLEKFNQWLYELAWPEEKHKKTHRP